MTHHGKFAWYELMTGDTGAAAAFYDDVIGWTSVASGMPGVDYSIFHAAGQRVAGLMRMPADAAAGGMPPAWLGYIAVDDVDAAAKKLAELGGTVHRQPDDIPQVGRFAVVSDPHGAMFYLFKGEGEAPFIPQYAPGNIGWNELMAGDLATAFPFYEAMFGWTKDQAMPMGELGDYQIFAQAGAAIGAIMTKPPHIPGRPYWGYYFNVEALDAAIDRLTSRGGQVVNGPMEVPGSAWVANCRDPQGAYFNLFAPVR